MLHLNDITVTNIGNPLYIYSQKGKHEQMNDRKSYGLSFCAEGQITYIQNGVSYLSHPQTAVILPKGGTYWIRRDKTGYFPVINFDCLESLGNEITVIPIQDVHPLLADFNQIRNLSDWQDRRAQIFSIFYGILHTLCSNTHPYELRKALRLIESTYSTPTLTNERLARECHISEVYLRKLFAKYLHSSPKQFIIRMRLQEAKQRLTEGTLAISAIAEHCGFSNPYHFSRVFKEHVGITPTEYRKRYQNFPI